MKRLLALILVACSSSGDITVCKDEELSDFSMSIKFESKDDYLNAYTLKMGFPNEAFSDMTEAKALKEFENNLGLEKSPTSNIVIEYEMDEDFIYSSIKFKNLDKITKEEYDVFGVYNDYTSDRKISDIVKEFDRVDGIICTQK